MTLQLQCTFITLATIQLYLQKIYIFYFVVYDYVKTLTAYWQIHLYFIQYSGRILNLYD